jgi:hypothetical protein
VSAFGPRPRNELDAPIDRQGKFLDHFARARGDDLGSKHLAIPSVDA